MLLTKNKTKMLLRDNRKIECNNVKHKIVFKKISLISIYNVYKSKLILDTTKLVL